MKVFIPNLVAEYHADARFILLKDDETSRIIAIIFLRLEDDLSDSWFEFIYRQKHYDLNVFRNNKTDDLTMDVYEVIDNSTKSKEYQSIPYFLKINSIEQQPEEINEQSNS